MKKFAFRLIWFFLAIFLVIIIGLLLPTTPRASKSLLMAGNIKDSLMQNTPSPRLIFVGGSNLSFGLNSQLIKDSLNLNPINTGIHGSIGLIFLLDNTLEYVKENDIIVVVSDYVEFYGDLAYGDEGQELMRSIFDVDIRKIGLLNLRQLYYVFAAIPKYSISKFKPSEYFDTEEDPVYGVNSFNKYGDVYTHWQMENVEFQPFKTLKGKYNPSVMEKIKDFQTGVEKKKAKLYISYPPTQDISYSNIKDQINEVSRDYEKYGFEVLGSAERYIFPDSMLFNSPTHLNKKGVDVRTRLFIEDFCNAHHVKAE